MSAELNLSDLTADLHRTLGVLRGLLLAAGAVPEPETVRMAVTDAVNLLQGCLHATMTALRARGAAPMSVEDIGGTGDFRATLEAMGEPELMAQQIVQQGATHAITTLLAHGCNKQTAEDMLASLRANMLLIETFARDKGYTRLFASAAPCAGTPAGCAPECGPHNRCHRVGGTALPGGQQ